MATKGQANRLSGNTDDPPWRQASSLLKSTPKPSNSKYKTNGNTQSQDSSPSHHLSYSPEVRNVIQSIQRNKDNASPGFQKQGRKGYQSPNNRDGQMDNNDDSGSNSLPRLSSIGRHSLRLPQRLKKDEVMDDLQRDYPSKNSVYNPSSISRNARSSSTDNLQKSPLTDPPKTSTYNHSRSVPNHDDTRSTTTSDDKRSNNNSNNNALRQRTQSDIGTDNKQLRRRYKPFTLSTQNSHFKDDDNQKNATNHARSHSGSALERLSQRRAQYRENVDLEKSLSPITSDPHNENPTLMEQLSNNSDENVTAVEDDHQNQDQPQHNEKETVSSLLGLSPIKNDIDLYKSDEVQDQLNPSQNNDDVHYKDSSHEIVDDHSSSSFNPTANNNVDLSPERDNNDVELPKLPSNLEPSLPPLRSNIDSVDYPHVPPKLPSSPPPLIPSQLEEPPQISNTNVVAENQNPIKTDSPVNTSIRNDIVSPLSPSSQLSSSSPFRSSISPFSDSSQDNVQKFSINKPVVQWTPSDVGNWLASVGLDAMKRRFTTNKIDGKQLDEMTKEKLEHIGVRYAMLRDKIMGKIKKLKDELTDNKPKQIEKLKEEVLPNFPTDNQNLKINPSDNAIEKNQKPIAISSLPVAAPPLPKSPSPDIISKIDGKSTPKDSPIQSPVNEYSHKPSTESLPVVNQNTPNETRHDAIPDVKSNAKLDKIVDSTEGMEDPVKLKKTSNSDRKYPSSRKRNNVKIDQPVADMTIEENIPRFKKTTPIKSKKVKEEDVTRESTVHLQNVILRFKNESTKDLAAVAASAGAEAAAIAARRFGLFFNKVNDADDRRRQRRMERLASKPRSQNESVANPKKDFTSTTTIPDQEPLAKNSTPEDYTCVSRNIAVKNQSYEVISSLQPDDDALHHPSATVAGQLLLIDDKYYYVPLSSPRSPHQLSRYPFSSNTVDEIPTRDEASESHSLNNNPPKEATIEDALIHDSLSTEPIDPLTNDLPKANTSIQSPLHAGVDILQKAQSHNNQDPVSKPSLTEDLIEPTTANYSQPIEAVPDVIEPLESSSPSQYQLDDTVPSVRDPVDNVPVYPPHSNDPIIPLLKDPPEEALQSPQINNDGLISAIDQPDNVSFPSQQPNEIFNHVDIPAEEITNKHNSPIIEAIPEPKSLNSDLQSEIPTNGDISLQTSYPNKLNDDLITSPVSYPQPVVDEYPQKDTKRPQEGHKELDSITSITTDPSQPPIKTISSMPIESMDSKEVSTWLDAIGLPKIATICQDKKIDGKDIQNLGSKLFEHSELRPKEHREILASEIYLMNNKPDRENSELCKRLKVLARSSSGSDKALSQAILEAIKSPPWCNGIDVDIDLNNKNISYPNGIVNSPEDYQAPILENDDNLKPQNANSSPYTDANQEVTVPQANVHNPVSLQNEPQPKVLRFQNIEDQNNSPDKQPTQKTVNTSVTSGHSSGLNDTNLSSDADVPSSYVPSSPPIRSGLNPPLFMQQSPEAKQDKPVKNKKKKITNRISKMFKPGAKSSDDKKKLRSQSQDEDDCLLRIDASILHRGQSVPGPSYKGFKVTPQTNCLQVIQMVLEKYEVHVDPKTYFISQESLDQTLPAVELKYDEYPLILQMKWPRNSKFYFELKRKPSIITLQMQVMVNDQPSDHLTKYEASTSTKVREIIQQQLMFRKVDVNNNQDWCLVELTHGGNHIFDDEECLDIDHHQGAQVLLLERSKLRSTSSSLSSTADDVDLTSSRNDNYPPTNGERPITIPVDHNNIAFIQKIQNEMNDSPTLEKLLAEINYLRNVVTTLQKRAASALENSIISSNAKTDLENAQQIHSQELDDKEEQLNKLRAAMVLKDKEIQQLQNNNKSKTDQLATLTGERDRALRLLQKFATGNDLTARLQEVQIHDDTINSSLGDKDKNELIKDLHRKEREKEFLQVYVNNILSVICEEAPQLLESVNRLQSSRL